MPKGLSLHIGLNYVDPDQYDGWDGELVACEFDANDMQELALGQGYTPKKLLREQATAKAVRAAITAAAKKLRSGDIFLLTYSGHGGQVPDTNGDEGQFGDTRDRKDETWCLYDRELVDDELAGLFSQFKKGVRVFALSDSCHSGSVTRHARPGRRRGRPRRMPRDVADRVYAKHKGMYDAIQSAVRSTDKVDVKATVLLISGCMDSQTSSDGDRNGYFTETMKRIWNDGSFSGGYRRFREEIVAEMDEDQTPNYFVIGAPNPKFEAQRPFTIDPSKKPKQKAKPKKGTREVAAAPRSLEAIDVVLAVLTDCGLRGPKGELPKADTDISRWFRRAEKEDKATDLPGGGRVGHFIVVIGERLSIDLSFADLVAGDYKTPQDIADLA